MEFQEVLEARRSIRQFDESKKVTKEMIQEMVYAALQAPSWKNSETARYHCILSEEALAKFRSECLPEFNQKSTEGASAMIVTTFVRDRSGYNRETGNPDNEIGNGWGCYDCGLSNEHLVLKAAELGLGTLIMGLRDTDRIREMLRIPGNEILMAVIAVGYPAVAPSKPKRREVEAVASFY